MPYLLASVGDRFTANFIDGIIAMAVGVATFYGCKTTGLALWWAFIGFLAYTLFRDGMSNGQSVGKRLTKIAVVHAKNEQPCTYWQSFVRNVPMVILGFFDLIPIVGKQRRRVGDFMASTKVVRLQPTA
ncbi:MAG: RDD family protein [Burkholderiales bacterium]